MWYSWRVLAIFRNLHQPLSGCVTESEAWHTFASGSSLWLHSWAPLKLPKPYKVKVGRSAIPRRDMVYGGPGFDAIRNTQSRASSAKSTKGLTRVWGVSSRTFILSCMLAKRGKIIGAQHQNNLQSSIACWNFSRKVSQMAYIKMSVDRFWTLCEAEWPSFGVDRLLKGFLISVLLELCIRI